MIDTNKVKSISLKQGELINRIICQTTFRNTSHGTEEIINLEAIKQIVDDCLTNLLHGQPELSPQTMRWLNKWFGTDYR
jgi:hypothetical protein